MPIARDYTALLDDSTWNGLAYGTPRIVTYSFSQSAPPYLGDNGYTSQFVNSFQAFTAQDEDMVRTALAQYQVASGLVFLEVAPGEGEIAFGHYNFDHHPQHDWAAGFAYGPQTNAEATYSWYSDVAGDVFVNTNYPNNLSLLLHEIGHALGLKHPFDGETTLAADLDDRSNTVMSYTGTRTGVLGYLDIDAIQYIYGLATPSAGTLLSWSHDGATDMLTQTWGSANSEIHGTPLDDIIDAGSGADTVAGHDGDDRLIGGIGPDILFGGSGDDWFVGGTGNDSIYGGRYWTAPDGGTDTVDYSSTTAGIQVWLDGDYDWTSGSWIHGVGAEIGTDKLYDIENAIAGAGNDSVTGTDGANSLFGGAGSDALYGGDGADFVEGGPGGDMIFGGADNDTASYQASPHRVIINLANGYAGGGDAAGDVLSGIESVRGTGLPDILVGSQDANTFTGGVGHDLLRGWGGDDVLHGEWNDDFLEGGSGSDMIFGGGGNDTAGYTSSAHRVVINLANGYAAGGDASGDVLSGIEGLAGSAHDDILVGDQAGNTLEGGDGEDLLRGWGGSDVLYGGNHDDWLAGGPGGDFIFGGEGRDTAGYSTSVHRVVINLANGHAGGGDAAGDVLSGIERVHGSAHSDILVGGPSGEALAGDAGADLLRGWGGDDGLFGGANDDVLEGGADSDFLSGGEGSDRFVFQAGWDTDIVEDFEDNLDKVDLSSFGFGNVSAALALATDTGPDTVFDFGGGDTLTVWNATKAQLQDDILIA